MQSNNPVFRRSEAFNGSQGAQAAAYGQQTYPGNGAGYAGYGQDPAQQGYAPAPTAGERMTIGMVHSAAVR